MIKHHYSTITLPPLTILDYNQHPSSFTGIDHTINHLPDHQFSLFTQHSNMAHHQASIMRLPTIVGSPFGLPSLSIISKIDSKASQSSSPFTTRNVIRIIEFHHETFESIDQTSNHPPVVASQKPLLKNHHFSQSWKTIINHTISSSLTITNKQTTKY